MEPPNRKTRLHMYRIRFQYQPNEQYILLHSEVIDTKMRSLLCLYRIFVSIIHVDLVSYLCCIYDG